MRRLRSAVAIVSILGMIGAFFATTPTHAADPFNTACNNPQVKSLPEDKKPAACREDGTKDPLSGGKEGLFYRIAQVISVLAGAIAVIMIIIGGINMMTSGGDSQKFSNGRNTLIFAAVGLIIVVLAQALITFVINKVT